jgi:membrane dipeptidase
MPTYPVFDAHCDSVILRQVRGDSMDLTVSDDAYHVDLPRLRQGHVAALSLMVGDMRLAQALTLIDATREMGTAHPAEFRLGLRAADRVAAAEAGQVLLVMTLESLSLLDEDLAPLRLAHALGVRAAGISHGEGQFGGPAGALQYDRATNRLLAPDERWRLRRFEKGLTPFAYDALAEMARLDMVCDLTHANDRAFWDIIERTDVRVYASHSNCAAVHPHTRNLTDDMLRALAARGGVVGVCPYAPFVGDAATATMAHLADHVCHALELAGERHVGIGGDFDGIPPAHRMVISDPTELPAFCDLLAERGVDAAALQRIAHDNMADLLFPAPAADDEREHG